MKTLPDYKDCLELCSYTDSPFSEKKRQVDGYQISIFNYRIASNSDFTRKYAKELRGLTFVYDGAEYKRFLLLEKFFNLNQNEETLYDVVKQYKIKSVNEKEDGSIISFIRLPNGRILAKSKASFETTQAEAANRIYRTDQDLKNLVDCTLNNDIIAVFEYVSPNNRIVLNYEKDELILLRLRDNKTGKILDIKDYSDIIAGVKYAKFYDDLLDLDTLIKVTESKENKEGFVVHAEDKEGNDFLFKLKTPWYSMLHGLLTEEVRRENIIIAYILEEKIDDVICQIPEQDQDLHDKINKIIAVVKNAINHKIAEIEKLVEAFISLESNKKEFALKYLRDPNFAAAITVINGCDIYEVAKKKIQDETKKLWQARKWLGQKDPSLILDQDEVDQ